ncbi:hypothetical protein JCM5353_006249 [Sporobolomyces roseus]
MVQTASTSSAIVTLLALTSILPQSVTGKSTLSSPFPYSPSKSLKLIHISPYIALPTHRSSSAITRRAHILSHHDSLPLSKRTNLGDHSVYVDASTSQPGGTGGVRNSTINLTVVSKRDSSSTFSTFSRVVRSLFRRSPPTPSSPIDTQVKLVALPQHTAAPYTKGHRTSRRQHQAAAALSRRSQSSSPSSNKVKRSTIPSPRIGIVVPPRPKNLKRSTIAERKLLERQNYDSGSSQASIYAAAVAAIEFSSSSAPSPPQITAEPVVALAMEIPSSLPPITLTMTLVPNSQGNYIDAAGASILPSPTSSTLSSKLRQRRSTFVERSQEFKNKQQQDTSQLKRSINPKTGSSPSSSASQTQQVQAPKWTAIAHY